MTPMAVSRIFGCVVLMLSTAFSASAQQIQGKGYCGSQYCFSYPSHWRESELPMPGRAPLKVFSDKVTNRSIGYCHVEEAPVVFAELRRMTDAQLRDFVVKNTDEERLFNLHPDLRVAPDLHVLQVVPIHAGRDMPAMMADVSHTSPQGFYFRARIVYVLNRRGQLSVWCKTHAKDPRDAEAEFHRQLQYFQYVIRTVRLK